MFSKIGCSGLADVKILAFCATQSNQLNTEGQSKASGRFEVFFIQGSRLSMDSFVQVLLVLCLKKHCAQSGCLELSYFDPDSILTLTFKCFIHIEVQVWL